MDIWKQGYTVRKHSRRKIIERGLSAGIAAYMTLTIGNLLAGCSPVQAQQEAKSQKVLDTSWKGLNFAWLPDNTHLAYTSDQGLFIVDRRDGKTTRSGSSFKITETVAWSANGTRIGYHANGKLVVQDVRSGQMLWSYQDQQHTTHNVALSPDGTRIAFSQDQPAASHPSSSPPNIAVQIWDMQKDKILLNLKASKTGSVEINSLIWSPDGTRIASTDQEGSVQLWSTVDGHPLWAYDVQKTLEPRGVLSWSPDGSSLAFAARKSQDQGLIGIWDAQTGKTRFQTETDVVYPIDQSSQNKRVAWSPDGARMAIWLESQSQPAIKVCSAHTGQLLFTCQPTSGQLTGITWSPDGSYLAAGNYIVKDVDELARGDNGDRSVIQFWDARNGKKLFTDSAPKSPDSLAWSPNSQFLALITPKDYDIVASKSCLSLCGYGYQNNALQVYQVE